MEKLTLFPNRNRTAWGMRYLLFQMLVLPTLLSLLNASLRLGLDESRLNLLYYTINFGALVWIFRNFLKISALLALKNLRSLLLTAAVGYLAYHFSSTIVAMATYYFLPDFSNVNDANISIMAQGDFAKWAFATIVLVPPAEELLFRGVLFGGFYSRNKILAWVLSVVGFALVHTIGYIGYYPWGVLLVCTLQYLPAGICLAAAYRHSGNIFAPILIHALINTLGILALK